AAKNSTNKNDLAEVEAILERLYTTLFAPLIPHIEQPNLMIAPHDVLHYLPFAALRTDTGDFLIEKYPITYIPSVNALRYIFANRNPNQEEALIFGNPDGTLPNTLTEVRSVAEIYATEPLTGLLATESIVHTQGPRMDVIHLAAHGNFDSVAPLQSAVELTGDDENDGVLEVREVFGLDLAEANLVFLSACETALGDQSMGDEITGLTRAFLYAGTPSIVTTLWSIEDEASGELVSTFYEALESAPSFAAALRAAQLKTMETLGWEDPYYWAAFTLHGDYLGAGERREFVIEPPTPTATPLVVHATGVTTPTLPTTLTPTPEPAVQLEITDNLNVRSGPGTAYPRIGALRAGNRVTVVGSNVDETWWEICCVDGQQGWIINNVNYMRVVETE
ncbi:MAG: CHAT domain-containing protein, partial [Caldilineaceae bacterium]|nr:CHAT domain-containing protein [Caldilineaceae bacterium]